MIFENSEDNVWVVKAYTNDGKLPNFILYYKMVDLKENKSLFSFNNLAYTNIEV